MGADIKVSYTTRETHSTRIVISVNAKERKSSALRKSVLVRLKVSLRAVILCSSFNTFYLDRYISLL